MKWSKSSRSIEGNCVEVAVDGPDVAVRDSKDPHGPVLHFERADWRAFVAALRRADL